MIMDKENRSAACLRRSAVAAKIRLREEWSALKGIPEVPAKNGKTFIEKEGHRLTKKKGNGLTKKKDNSFTKKKDDSFTKKKDDSLTKKKDNSLTKKKNNGLTKKKDNSVSDKDRQHFADKKGGHRPADKECHRSTDKEGHRLTNKKGTCLSDKKLQNITNKQTSKKNQKTEMTKVKIKACEQTNEVLRGVVALVEVGAKSRALALRAALSALGATVVPAWSPLVTHLIWAEGGCRETRAKARVLASRLVSPLWVEACAVAKRRLPERTFPAATRPSDLPSPKTLRRLLKMAEMGDVHEDNVGVDGKIIVPSVQVAAEPPNSYDAYALDLHSHCLDLIEDTSCAESSSSTQSEPFNVPLPDPVPQGSGRPRRGWAQALHDGKFNIVLTGMSPCEKIRVSTAVQKMGARVQAEVNSATTHVLLGNKLQRTQSLIHPQRRVNLTFKTLSGAVRGCYVLHSEWAEHSEKEGRWKSHLDYEVSELYETHRMARMERHCIVHTDQPYALNIFEGQRIALAKNVPKRARFAQLLSLCGARIHDLSMDWCAPQIIVGPGMNQVKTRWIYDCITSARCRTVCKYINRRQTSHCCPRADNGRPLEEAVDMEIIENGNGRRLEEADDSEIIGNDNGRRLEEADDSEIVENDNGHPLEEADDSEMIANDNQRPLEVSDDNEIVVD